MRTRQWLFAMMICGVSAAALGACSSSDDKNTTTDSPDSGVKGDTGTGGDACTPVNLSTLDAGTLAINDAGATTGTCLKCMQTSCGTQLTTCSGDCVCSTSVSSFVQCLGSGQGTGCFTSGISSLGSDPSALSGNPLVPLLTCMVNNCVDGCGIDTSKLPGFGGGTDAGAAADTGTPAADAATGG